MLPIFSPFDAGVSSVAVRGAEPHLPFRQLLCPNSLGRLQVLAKEAAGGTETASYFHQAFCSISKWTTPVYKLTWSSAFCAIQLSPTKEKRPIFSSFACKSKHRRNEAKCISKVWTNQVIVVLLVLSLPCERGQLVHLISCSPTTRSIYVMLQIRPEGTGWSKHNTSKKSTLRNA